jgi:hypothetical protein
MVEAQPGRSPSLSRTTANCGWAGDAPEMALRALGAADDRDARVTALVLAMAAVAGDLVVGRGAGGGELAGRHVGRVAQVGGAGRVVAALAARARDARALRVTLGAGRGHRRVGARDASRREHRPRADGLRGEEQPRDHRPHQQRQREQAGPPQAW